jgi:NAD(P)-dependent dehydrogenase (short-subunit alcohol dehydrogenase family)
MKLTGNTILITGGGSGIGRGLAEALHQRKNQVVVAGRRKDRLTEVARANPGMAWVVLDIEDPASISNVAKKLTADYPKLNVLINNAGIMNIDDVSTAIDDKLLVSTLTTNVMGPIRMSSKIRRSRFWRSRRLGCRQTFLAATTNPGQCRLPTSSRRRCEFWEPIRTKCWWNGRSRCGTTLDLTRPRS